MTEDEMRLLPKPELYLLVLANLEKITRVFDGIPEWYVRSRPLVGGVFGLSGFSLCSYAHVNKGLDSVLYMVRETDSGFVISQGEDKAAALAGAREILKLGAFFPLGKHIADYKFRKAEAIAAAEKLKHQQDAEYQLTVKGRRSATVRSIPRRRRKIFEESGGQCHYCSTPLTLDGRWHVEHKMPRALGGDDSPGNLVASCAPCNHEKRDTTDQEFLAKRAQRAA
jgi:5-methylcytosine-specific restriction endonuclease McrA